MPRRPEYQAFLDRRVDEELAAHGDIEPPWVRFPELRWGSIGWRMGSGESWLGLWRVYVERMEPLELRLAYLGRFPAAPRTWKRALTWQLGSAVAGDVEADDEARAMVHHIIDRAGLLADDAAYPVWVDKCRRDGGVVAPWATRRPMSPAKSLRYRQRVLGWWARWCAETQELDGWVASQPAATGDWTPVREALVARRLPPQRVTSEDLVVELAGTGTLAPPWTYAAEPVSEVDFDMDAPIGAKWAWWIGSVFDDVGSWRAYLRQWPPPPVRWDQALRKRVPWLHAPGNDV